MGETTDTLRRNLALTWAAFIEAHNVSMSRASIQAINDPGWLRKQLGKSAPPGFNTTTFDRMMVWLSENWPTDAVWPDNVLRPATKRRRKN